MTRRRRTVKTLDRWYHFNYIFYIEVAQNPLKDSRARPPEAHDRLRDWMTSPVAGSRRMKTLFRVEAIGDRQADRVTATAGKDFGYLTDPVCPKSGSVLPHACYWHLPARELCQQARVGPYSAMKTRLLKLFVRAVDLIVVQPESHQDRVQTQDRA